MARARDTGRIRTKPGQSAGKSGLTVEEFARVIGASIAAVDLWRAKGMPVEIESPTGRPGRPRLRIDLAKATDWLVANKLGGFGAPESPGAPLPDFESISDEPGLAGAVARGRAAERLSFRILREAIAARDSLKVRAALENWREFGRTLSDLEKRLSERAAIEKEIHDATQQAVRDWCEPKRAFIETLPYAFASRLLNLRKPSAVEMVLNDLVKTLLRQLSEPVTLVPRGDV